MRFLLKGMSAVDPALLAHASEFVGDGAVVWDVGANVGLFSVAAASRARSQGRVYAIEPDAWLVGLLRRTAKLQPPDSAQIDVIPCGIARDAGIRTFSIAKRSRSSNHLVEYGHSQAGGVAEQQTIVTFALDDLLRWIPAPSVVKVDVEGAEAEVLQGARVLLEEHRPVVILEVGEQGAAEVTHILKSRSYCLFDGETPGPSRRPIDRATWNTIAVPA
ncbi:MAG TPA: FkbM family methyltransferase [Thermoanaerobaculia bacterium]|nr:FkbM family methyltransferase [Thermoanaerobaculia bacterium]